MGKECNEEVRFGFYILRFLKSLLCLSEEVGGGRGWERDRVKRMCFLRN